MKNASLKLAHRQVCREFSWLLSYMGGANQGMWFQVVGESTPADHEEQDSTQCPFTVTASVPVSNSCPPFLYEMQKYKPNNHVVLP